MKFLYGFIAGGIIAAIVVYGINYNALQAEAKRMNNLLYQNAITIYQFGYECGAEGMPKEEGQQQVMERIRR